MTITGDAVRWKQLKPKVGNTVVYYINGDMLSVRRGRVVNVIDHDTVHIDLYGSGNTPNGGRVEARRATEPPRPAASWDFIV